MRSLREVREMAKEYDCNVCGSKHSRSEIRVLGKLESAWILRARCTNCQTISKLLVVEQVEPAGMLGRP